MANNVIAQVMGGDKKVIDSVNTVADVRARLGAGGYAATVNGDAADDSTAIETGDFVCFAQAVKGGLR